MAAGECVLECNDGIDLPRIPSFCRRIGMEGGVSMASIEGERDDGL